MYYRIGKKEGKNRDSAKGRSFSPNEVAIFEDFIQYMQQRIKHAQTDAIPIEIFRKTELAPLEAVVKYLRENLQYTYAKIASLLNRKAGPIGVSYRNAKKKLPLHFEISLQGESLPLSIFKDSKLTVFETMVVYLKDSGLKFGAIARILNRHYRTIWTVYQRARIKNAK